MSMHYDKIPSFKIYAYINHKNRNHEKVSSSSDNSVYQFITFSDMKIE